MASEREVVRETRRVSTLQPEFCLLLQATREALWGSPQVISTAQSSVVAGVRKGKF